MQEKTVFEKVMSAKLKEWQYQIEAVKLNADLVAAQQQLEYYRQLDLLDAKFHLACEKFGHLQKAEGVNWRELQASLEGIGNEIENALNSAQEKVS